MSTGTIKTLGTGDAATDSALSSTLPAGTRLNGAARSWDVPGTQRASRSERRREHFHWFEPGTRSLRCTVLTTLPLAIADVLSLLAAALGAAGLVWLLGFSGPVEHLRLLLALECSLLVTFVLLGLYPGVGLNPVVELRQVICAITLVFAVFLAAIATQHLFGAGPHAVVAGLAAVDRGGASTRGRPPGRSAPVSVGGGRKF